MRETIHDSVRFLDNVIDANNYQLPEIDAMCKGNRKIGLGIMGFADALFMLNVRYSSDEGVDWGECFMKFINDEAHNYSEKLARERGCFPNWKGSTWDTVHSRPMRNACCTTVAPTGTISIISGCSGGIEPLFSLAFFRNVLKGQDEGKTPMVEINEIFERVARERGFYSEGLMDQIARDGTLAHIDGIPDDVKHVFVCAHDITPEWHVRMQAAFQRHCDSSISKTINFPHEAKVEDVETIYRLAYELRCKGVTVYRDGCRSSQPMALKDSESKAKGVGSADGRSDRQDAGSTTAESRKEAPVKFEEIEPKDIPEIVSGFRIRQMTPFGNMHVKITIDPKTGHELEVFAQLGKGGDIANSDLEAICRMISLWLRAGGAFRHVIRQLKDIGSSLQVPTREGKIMSLGDGLARALQKYARAKERFGLRSLLLGEYDLADLDRPVASAPSTNGHGNGHGGGNGNGHEHVSEVRHATAAHGHSATAEVPQEAGNLGISVARLAFKVKCPDCGESLVFAEGCNKCYTCGWAPC
jgi:ribonucleoside-diphosphate reductase alpha chain